MSETVRRVGVGLIGAGNFAQHQHLPNLARIPECQLVAVCDVREPVARATADRWHAAYASTDHQKLLADPAIDAVVIAVRDDLQAPIAVAALNAGKHVYVEKPLAETPEACAPVIAAQRGSRKRLAVGFNRRFAPIYRKLREVVSADGGPFNIHFRMADDAWRWAHGYPPGYLVKHDICHLFDMLRWLTGAQIATVYAVASRPDDDCITCTLTNGTIASIIQSAHGTMDMPKERADIITRRGGVMADDFVELRTYGYPNVPHVFTFAGHSHPDREFMHKYLFEKMGAQAFHAIRRMTWEMRNKPEAYNEPDAAEMRQYAEKTLPNFMRDQGWLAALRAFIVGIAADHPTDHATAADALAAAQAAEAAVQSRTTGEVVRMAVGP